MGRTRDSKKYNLTIIDQIPEVNNFLYRGISESDKAEIEKNFHSDAATLKFHYDEGEAHLKISNIHSMVFAEYISAEAEEAAMAEREDD